jgi:hypothetical protein
VHASESVEVVVYGQECGCAGGVDCDFGLGVCEYGGGRDVGSEGDVGGECVFVGVPFVSDFGDWEFCNVECQSGMFLTSRFDMQRVTC